MLTSVLHVAAYASIAVFALLVLANVVLTMARLSGNRYLAARVTALLYPFASLFRLGTIREHETVQHEE